MPYRSIFVVFTGVWSAAALAAPPVNDNWGDRIAMPPATVLSPRGFSDSQTSIADATTEASDPLLVCKTATRRSAATASGTAYDCRARGNSSTSTWPRWATTR